MVGNGREERPSLCRAGVRDSNGERTLCEGRKDSSRRGNTRLNQKHGTYVQEITAETLALFP